VLNKIFNIHFNIIVLHTHINFQISP